MQKSTVMVSVYSLLAVWEVDLGAELCLFALYILE